MGPLNDLRRELVHTAVTEVAAALARRQPGYPELRILDLTANPHTGKFKVVRSSYLSAVSQSHADPRAWYLLADPMDVPVMEVVFLNGQEMPVIEDARADFSTLGIKMRGFYDFGVAKQDPRGAVKMMGR